MFKIPKSHQRPDQRKRATSDVFRDAKGRPFAGENWRKSVYQPLNPGTKQIRVLLLLPSGCLDSDVVCCLVTVDLDQDDVLFYAISYVWGDQSQTKFICLNGFNVKVGQNAYTALRNVRHPQSPRLVWIDSLCINQADVAERNHQVKRMKDVYSRASRVLLCVCEPSQYVDTAITELVAVQRVDMRSPCPSLISKPSTPPVGATLQGVKEAKEEKWASIATFLELPFWRRLWIVQEISLGNTHKGAIILVGRSRILYHIIGQAVSALTLNSLIVFRRSNSPLRRGTPFARVLTSCRAWCACRAVIRPLSNGFIDIFTMQIHLEASDERDRVYGLLALFPELETKVDYNKTTVKVYEDVTVSLIDALGCLESMFHREYSVNNAKALASWATDLRVRSDQNLWIWAKETHKYYNASGDATLRVPLIRHGRFISVQGSKVSDLDRAATIGAENMYNGSEKKWHCHMERVMEFAMRLVCDRDAGMGQVEQQVLECGRAVHLDLLRTEADISPSFWRVDGRKDLQNVTGDLRSFAAAWRVRCTSKCESNGNRTFRSSTERKRFGNLAYCDFTVRMLREMRVAMDSSGHLCVVPAATQVGDVIYLLAGSTVPFVLHPAEDATRSLFRVVGPAYVHGIMDGELVYDCPRRVSTGDPDAYDEAFGDIWLC